MPESTTNSNYRVPDDNLSRKLAVKSADDNSLHLGVAGDTYTILLSGEDTLGRFSLIDMYVPHGGGPPSHRHEFEETFVLLEGELELTFRGGKRVVKAGETVSIPGNAPHAFHNSSARPVRMLCICAPAGQEELFRQVGTPVATRTTPAPKMTDEQEADFIAKLKELAPKYHSELLKEAR